MCGKQQVSIIDLNTFLDGISLSKLWNTDTIVKKKLLIDSPNIINTLRNILKLHPSKEFTNNYFGLLRSVQILEFMPLPWFS